jgi:hypothetical protein
MSVSSLPWQSDHFCIKSGQKVPFSYTLRQVGTATRPLVRQSPLPVGQPIHRHHCRRHLRRFHATGDCPTKLCVNGVHDICRDGLGTTRRHAEAWGNWQTGSGQIRTAVERSLG